MLARVAFLALLAVAAVSAETEVEDDVLVLTESNFDDEIAKNDFILVEFYAPWCGHCKKLAPEYAKAAGQLKDEPIALAKVDATEQKELAEKFSIKGFPTLKFFKGGRASEYNGGRTANEIVQWLRKKSGPAAATLESADDLLALKEANEVCVVGFFDSKEAEGYEAFFAAAGMNDDTPFAVVVGGSVAEELGFEGIVLFKKFDEGEVRYEGDVLDKDAIDGFVRANSLPLINAFTKESARAIFAGAIKQHLLYFAEAPVILANTEELKTVARDYKGEFLFVTVEPTPDNQRLIEYFGVTSTEKPSAILVNMAGGGGDLKKYRLEGETTTAAIRVLLEDFKKGALKPWLKSEERPDPESQEGDVVVVVGKSFEEVVLDETKDVLLEFYAPWCGHCKKLAPIYDELAANLKEVAPDLVIAKMDATANEVDHPKVNVRGFPTVILFKAGAGEDPLVYDGPREVDDFVKFLQKEVTHKFTLAEEAAAEEPVEEEPAAPADKDEL